MGIDMKFVLFSDRHMPHLRFTSAPHGRGEALLLMKGAETKKKPARDGCPMPVNIFSRKSALLKTIKIISFIR